VVLGSDWALRHHRYSPLTNWGAHTLLDPPDGRPCAVGLTSHTAGHHEYLVGTADGVVHHAWQWQDGPMSKWFEFGQFPGPVRSIATASIAEGHQEVFVLAGDGTLWHRWYWQELAWSEWVQMVTPELDTPSAIAGSGWGHGRMALFLAGGDGQVAYRSCALGTGGGPLHDLPSTWSDWESLGEVSAPVLSVAASSLVDGHVECFVLTPGGQLAHRWLWEGFSWSGWEPFSAEMPTSRTGERLTPVAIAAGSHSDRHHELFAVCDGGAVVTIHLVTRRPPVPGASRGHR